MEYNSFINDLSMINIQSILESYQDYYTRFLFINL